MSVDLDDLQARTERAAEYQQRRGGRWWSSTKVPAIAPFKAISPEVWLEVIRMARISSVPKGTDTQTD